MSDKVLDANGKLICDISAATFSMVSMTPTGVAVVAAAGTLAAGTYTYSVSATNPLGESLASATVQLVLGATGGASVSWGRVRGATGYKVYGRTGLQYALATVTSQDILSWVDDGSVTGTYPHPGGDTTSHIRMDPSLGATRFGVGTFAVTHGTALGYGASAGDTDTSAVGHNANASVARSVAAGAGAFADGGDSVAIGAGAFADQLSIAVGAGAFAQNGGVAIGAAARADEYGIAIGAGAQCESTYGGVALGAGAISTGSMAIGRNTQTTRPSGIEHSADALSTTLHQWANYNLYATTTDASNQYLRHYGGVIPLTMTDGSAISFRLSVVAVNASTGDTSGWYITGVAYRYVDGIVITLGTPETYNIGSAFGTCTVVDYSDEPAVQITGVAATTIEWSARMEVSEVRT